MATHVITIDVNPGDNSTLTISDDENHTANTHPNNALLTTTVDAGDTVKWTIASGSAISSITNITDKSTVNVFSSGPSAVNDGTGDWSGIIGSGHNGEVEAYSITYTVGNQTFTEDPKLSVNT